MSYGNLALTGNKMHLTVSCLRQHAYVFTRVTLASTGISCRCVSVRPSVTSQSSTEM